MPLVLTQSCSGVCSCTTEACLCCKPNHSSRCMIWLLFLSGRIFKRLDFTCRYEFVQYIKYRSSNQWSHAREQGKALVLEVICSAFTLGTEQRLESSYWHKVVQILSHVQLYLPLQNVFAWEDLRSSYFYSRLICILWLQKSLISQFFNCIVRCGGIRQWNSHSRSTVWYRRSRTFLVSATAGIQHKFSSLFKVFWIRYHDVRILLTLTQKILDWSGSIHTIYQCFFCPSRFVYFSLSTQNSVYSWDEFMYIEDC